MSDNKKYFKLKDTFFKDDVIQVIEAQENGYIYSNIILKLFLISIKYNGQLKINKNKAYNINNLRALAKAINFNTDYLRTAIMLANGLDIIKITENGELWMNEVYDD